MVILWVQIEFNKAIAIDDEQELIDHVGEVKKKDSVFLSKDPVVLYQVLDCLYLKDFKIFTLSKAEEEVKTEITLQEV